MQLKRQLTRHGKKTGERYQAGYTLIELAAVLIVIGLLIATFAPIYQVELKQTAVKESKTHLALINSAIGDFRAAHGRYPCPASLTADRTSPNYGFEDCSNMATIAPGNCTPGNGVCIQTGMRNVTLPDGTVLTTTGSPLARVRAGGLPFRQLNLAEDEALDGWDDRYIYAVSENLIAQTTFGFDGGSIDVRNGLANGPSVLSPPATVDFIVTSQGQDRVGAYTRDGVQYLPCPGTTEPESSNCSRGANAVYTIMTHSEVKVGSGKHFDDFVAYYSRGGMSPWQLSEDANNSGNIFYVSKGTATAPALRFLASNSPPKAGVALQNENDTRVRPFDATNGGSLKTGPICDANGANCTSAKAIGSDLSTSDNNMKCPNPFSSGQYMTGIANNHAICTDEVKIVCAKGRVMTGVGPDGKPVCSSSPCPSKPVNVCGTTQTLPIGYDTTPDQTFSGGANYQQTFRCVTGSGAGTWTSVGSTGSCVCTQKAPQTKNVACATGFSGQIKQTRTWTCPDGSWTGYVETSNTCVCVGAQQVQNICPTGAGNTGSHNQVRNFVCSADGKSGTWSAWTDSGANTCTCTSTTKDQTLGCPSGQNGSIVQTATYNCSAKKWGPWVTKTNTCTCDSTQTDTQTLSCPTRVDSSGVAHEQIGEITQTRSIQCPSSKWGNWTTVKNTCQDKPPVVCYWSSKGSGNSGTTAFGSEVGSTCGTCGATASCHQTLGSQTYKNYATCSCE